MSCPRHPYAKIFSHPSKPNCPRCSRCGERTPLPPGGKFKAEPSCVVVLAVMVSLMAGFGTTLGLMI